ncbi:hypothetical protein [Planctomicrobium piriforme]|uniref:Uncharacterized protein n=1 Tax=Planctomicrobium piriforme TaxID=1576369 RepID=A0A1I3PZQ2_9PLAN|nr:hypothetical protein [Planctomicrobium piriforme]SFJ27384.1 hypothetical protein SAMN05421753_117103 [Planctomicrobium piriforme]
MSSGNTWSEIVDDSTLKLNWERIEPLLEKPTEAIAEEFQQLFRSFDPDVQSGIVNVIGYQLDVMRVRSEQLESLLVIIMNMPQT